MWEKIGQRIKNNWQSGLTVALVSIPLSISLAVASRANPVIGIVTAIWAGLVASIFGGSNFNIVGPTGALSGILATYAIIHGEQTLPMLAILTGAMIILAYVLRLERYLVLIPSSVIHGFILGVAFIIGFNQLNFALGLSGLKVHEKFFDNLLESFAHLNQASTETFILFGVFLIGLFLLRKLMPKLPGAVLLTPIGIGIGYLSSNQVIPLTIATLGTKFGVLQFHLFEMPKFYFSAELLTTSITVAIVAILETMLSAKIADGMTHSKHDGRREMRGLGLANVISGLMGGMPATAALARTSLNIKSGANHSSSATISTIFITIISVFMLTFFTYIPLAVIAAILVYVAIQMIEMENFVKYFHYEKTGFFIALAVAAITVYEDPIIGMLFGTAIALILFVEKLSHGHFSMVVNTYDKRSTKLISGTKLEGEQNEGDFSLYSIRGKMCYVNSRAHVARFEANFRTHKHIILRLREVYFMDLDGVEALDEIIDLVLGRGQNIYITSVSPDIAGLLSQLSKGYQRLKKDGAVFGKSEEVIDHLISLARKQR